MKILTTLTYYTPNLSGVTIYAEILNRFLAKSNQVSVLTSRFKKSLPKREKKENVSILRPWSPIKINKGIIMPFYPINSLKQVLKNDLIICHLPQLEAVWPIFWAKILRKKSIIVHHCEFAGGPGIKNKLIKWLVYLPHYLSYKTANKIIAYTEDYARHSIFLSKFLDKTEFILPPVAVGKKDNREINKIAKEIGKNKSTKIIGFVGRIGWEKGIDVLLKAIPFLEKKLKDFKIVLVGPYKNVVGDNAYQRLKPFFQKYKKRVILVGSIPHQKLVNYYHNFDCLVLPSTNNLETFGIVQAEAMLCDCPVVASNLPGVRMPIKLTGMGKIVPVGSSKKLAEKTLFVIENRKRLVGKQPLAETVFSQTVFRQKYNNLTKNLTKHDQKQFG